MRSAASARRRWRRSGTACSPRGDRLLLDRRILLLAGLAAGSRSLPCGRSRPAPAPRQPPSPAPSPRPWSAPRRELAPSVPSTLVLVAGVAGFLVGGERLGAIAAGAFEGRPGARVAVEGFVASVPRVSAGTTRIPVETRRRPAPRRDARQRPRPLAGQPHPCHGHPARGARLVRGHPAPAGDHAGARGAGGRHPAGRPRRHRGPARRNPRPCRRCPDARDGRPRGRARPRLRPRTGRPHRRADRGAVSPLGPRASAGGQRPERPPAGAARCSRARASRGRHPGAALDPDRPDRPLRAAGRRRARRSSGRA